MPSASHFRDEDDDPVIASYDVFITPQTKSAEKQSRLFVLQYPAHRPPSKPYNAARSQQPTSLRLKPTTRVVELDIPLFTSQNYNVKRGTEYGHAMAETKAAHAAGGYGLSGGFANGQQNASLNIGLQDIPSHDEEHILQQQTLAGKAIDSSDREPVYMLASMRNDTKSIHLSHLDAVIQMRPQLHHLDAMDELNVRKAQGGSAASKTGSKLGPEVGAGPSTANGISHKLETKAIEMKLKDASSVANTNDPNRERNLNVNAKVLRDIQAETWRTHTFVDEAEDPAMTAREVFLHHQLTAKPQTGSGINTAATGRRADLSNVSKLKSRLDNDEWLDRMSSPGIELRTRLKGRDRERARRKRQERLRNAKPAEGAEIGNGTMSVNATGAGASIGPFVEEGTATEEEEDDEESSESEAEAEHATNAEDNVPRTGIDATPVPLAAVDAPNEPDIKVDPDASTVTDVTSSTKGATIRADSSISNVTSPSKKRGRPKKVSMNEGADLK